MLKNSKETMATMRREMQTIKKKLMEPNKM